MNVELVMFKDNGERKDFPLAGSTTVIGRKEDCDIRIPLQEVSRRHAEFTISGEQLQLRDLKSANGTFVNNQRVKEKNLAPGDRVVIGPVIFTVRIDGKPEKLKPAKTKVRRKPSDLPPEDQALLAEADLSGLSGSADLGGASNLGASGDLDIEATPEKSQGAASGTFSDSLAESDLALEALSESSSMTFDLDDLDLDSEEK